jgi:hypothetical protein
MTSLRRLLLLLALLPGFFAPSIAQDVSHTPGPVWNFTYVKVEDGQMQRYLDHLAGEWKRLYEFGKKEGYVLSYHVLSVNARREGEPDLILAVQYRDYYSNAEQLKQQKRFEEHLATTTRKMEAQLGERNVIRKLMGYMELQELNLK